MTDSMHIFPVPHLPKVRFEWNWHEYKPAFGSQRLQDLEDVCGEWTQIFGWSCLWFCIEDGPVFTQEFVDVGSFFSRKYENGANISRLKDLSRGSPMNRKNHHSSSCHVLYGQLISQYFLRIPQGIELPFILRRLICEPSLSPHCTASSKCRNAQKKTLRSLRDLTSDIPVTPWYWRGGALKVLTCPVAVGCSFGAWLFCSWHLLQFPYNNSCTSTVSSLLQTGLRKWLYPWFFTIRLPTKLMMKKAATIYGMFKTHLWELTVFPQPLPYLFSFSLSL